MELTKIENLLEAYFEGNTSLDQERILQNYFTQAYVPTHLQQYKAMFDYFSISKAETSTQKIQLNPKKKTWKLIWLPVAASVILLFAIYKIIPNTNSFTSEEKEKAEKAFVESQKAFQLISDSLARGNEKLAYLEHYEETKYKIFKNPK